MKSLHCCIYIAYLYIFITEVNSSFFNTIASLLGFSNNTNFNTTVEITIVKKRDIKDTIKTIKRDTVAVTNTPDIKLEVVTTKHDKKFYEKKNKTLLPVCDEDHLMAYLAELQAINPESIINLSTVDELDLICRQVADNLDKIDTFLLTCRIPDEKDLYVQLIKGVDKLYDVICEESSKIRMKFEDHFACLKELHDDFVTCYGPPDWTEDRSRKEVCRAYKEIADCYYIKSAKVCGLAAANAMKTVIKAVMDTILSCQCKNVIIHPLVRDPAPEPIINNAKNNANNIGYINLIITIPLLFLVLK